MPISAMRACSLSFAVPATASPATSPFTSAMNTGTPIREKPSAIVISETVLPVPVAPATSPWRLPNFGSRNTWPWLSGSEAGVVTALPMRIAGVGSIAGELPVNVGPILCADRNAVARMGALFRWRCEVAFTLRRVPDQRARMNADLRTLAQIVLAGLCVTPLICGFPLAPLWFMPAFARASVALLALGFAFSPEALALSKRDQAAVDALNQRMQAAEARYRQGVVKIGNADPSGKGEVDASLEDMEDVMADCVKQKGCSATTMLTAYKRLLKQNADLGRR